MASSLENSKVNIAIKLLKLLVSLIRVSYFFWNFVQHLAIFLVFYILFLEGFDSFGFPTSPPILVA